LAAKIEPGTKIESGFISYSAVLNKEQ